MKILQPESRPRCAVPQNISPALSHKIISFSVEHASFSSEESSLIHSTDRLSRALAAQAAQFPGAKRKRSVRIIPGHQVCGEDNSLKLLNGTPEDHPHRAARRQGTDLLDHPSTRGGHDWRVGQLVADNPVHLSVVFVLWHQNFKAMSAQSA